MGKYTRLLFPDVKIRRDSSSENYFEHTPTVLHVKTKSVHICLFSPVSLTFSSISPAQNKCIPQMIQYVWHDAGVRTTLQNRTAKAYFLALQMSLHDLYPCL